MDSSFLTWVNVGLGLFSGVFFFKLIIQFGLPNHPARFMAYMVSLCAFAFFGLMAVTSLGFLAPWLWLKWNPLPIVAGSLGFLLQIVTSVGRYGRIQQKVMSRIPLIAGILCVAFFPTHAETFFIITIVAGCIFLSVSVGKARILKRHVAKMSLFLALVLIGHKLNTYWFFVFGQISLFGALFYFFLCEQAFCIASKIDDYQLSREGVSE